jgi:hypothetical protein
MKKLFLFFMGVLFLFSATAFPQTKGRIYGTIYTEDGEKYEGIIRWDKNEAFWDDILDGTKELDSDYSNQNRTTHHLKIFGIVISWDENEYGATASSGIMFGQIRSLIPESDNEVLIELKDGSRVTLSGGATDIGDNIRSLTLEDEQGEEISLEWDEIEKIVFSEPRPKFEIKEMDLGEPLYGKIMTEEGDGFEGFICWDLDEVLSTDILDGNEKGKRRKIPFEKIRKIRKENRDEVLVFLKNGKEMNLDGTNDVNSSNQGILIKDSDFGQVQIPWEEFEEVEFLPVPVERLKNYGEFDTKELYGEVSDEHGKKYQGKIRWDDDEEQTWELLNGEYQGLDVRIPFSEIKSIEKDSDDGAFVTIKNGKRILLKNSNDVNDENKGIFIKIKRGKEKELDWDEFSKVEFY